jgi:hypothetical protein
MVSWLDDVGLVALPSGLQVRGRRIKDDVSPADFALLLADGPVPGWAHRRIRWPDFWIPLDRDDALDALHEAYERAQTGQRIEVTCRGGQGRTGTALAGLAVLDGVPRIGRSAGCGSTTTRGRWKLPGSGAGCGT